MSLKVLELFSGIGAQHKALTNLGLDVECTQCEIDKYAIQAYNAIHGETKNIDDICKVNEEDLQKDQWDLITYSFPCTNISIAGKQKGFIKGSGTASSLLWEVEKFINKVKPKYLLMENVKALVSKKFKPHFETWLNLLDSYGYKSYWEVLNAKDYGVPQNRERVFVVSIRKDIEQEYKFPEKQPLTIRLKDMLEDSPNEKYYLSQKIQERFKLKPIGNSIIGTTKGEDNTRLGQRDLCYKEDGVMGTLTSTDYKQPKQVAIEQIGTLDIKGNDILKRVYSSEGLSPTLNTMQGGNTQPKIIEYNFTEQVKVRKYPVDIEKLKQVLKDSKIKSNKTNKEIAKVLDKPLTNVEHWFRQDSSFSIPSEDIWFKLKDILDIKTDEFDSSITEFIIKDNEYDIANRTYSGNGISPTLTTGTIKVIEPYLNFVGGIGEPNRLNDGKQNSRNWKEGYRVYDSNNIGATIKAQSSGLGGNSALYKVEEPKILEMNKEARHQQDLVQHEDGICRCIPAGTHGSTPHLLKTMVSMKSEPKVIEEPICCASRGRNPKNPSDRTVGAPTEQRLEINMKGITNTLTSVQKDNYIIEPSKIVIDSSIRPGVAKNFEREKEEILNSTKDIYQAKCDSGFQDNKIGLKISPTLRASNSFTATLDNNYRIRKLTPRECYRLMGFTDADFDKVKAVGMSDTQCYKQAGNSIVVNVLEAIFKNLLLK